ncbi:MAG: TonB-dependent receptor [Proteobacteria bacterium]|nr:TonB-dependent receptor [Pseudomonadota bacterium]
MKLSRMKSGNRHTKAPLCALFVAALGAAGPLRAQDPVPAAAAPASSATLGEIVVTAQKFSQPLARVPESITAFTPQALHDFHIKSFTDYATKTPNLSFTYGSGPTGFADARTVAIRGITGQNLFGTSGATGFYIDDTPMPSSVDPRIVDIDNIQVLEGPQGTLYGESSLGGNVKLVTNQPNLEVFEGHAASDVGATSGGGSPDYGTNAVVNLPVLPRVLAVRMVGFYSHDAGYLTRTYPTNPQSPGVTNPFLDVPRSSVGDQGATTAYGGSMNTLWRVSSRFDASLLLMTQEEKYHGFPATFAPLPSFTPVYTLDRAFDVQPTAFDRWQMASLTLKYHGTGWDLVSATSYFHRHTEDIEDSTYGTQQIFASYYQVSGLPAQPYLWQGDHYFNQFNNETRLSFQPVHGVSGTIGWFVSNSRALFSIPATYANGLVAATANNAVVGPWPNDLIWTQSNPGKEKDYALFGQVYWKFLPRFTLTLGARQYWLRQYTNYTANGFMNFGATGSDPQSNSQHGLDPKVALSYQASRSTLLYVSAAKGFRAGNAQAYAPFCAEPNLPVTDITQLRSDTLWTYEGGIKVQLSNPGVLLTADGFHINWNNIQQQVALPCGAYFDINGGQAEIDGGEFQAMGYLMQRLQVRIGIGYEKTDLTKPGALGLVGLAPGSRLMGVPAVTASAGAIYRRPITARVSGFLAANYSYTGNSESELNGGAGRTATRPSFSLVDARIGIDWGRSELSLNGTNLTNARPNLGDIGYVGYAQYNAAGTIISQVATMRPATATVEYSRSF